MKQVLDDINEASFVIRKRDGRIEAYNPDKMRKVIEWACDGNAFFVNEIMKNAIVNAYNEMPIQELYDEVIQAAVNLISRLYQEYEYIAAKLLLQKLYKTRKRKPLKLLYADFINKHNIGSSDIDELDEYMDFSRDFLFTYKGLHSLAYRYLLDNELPQQAYMRVAIALSIKDTNFLESAKSIYDCLSKHEYTVATPIFLNAGRFNNNLSSCVLMQVDDSTESITKAVSDMALYSKMGGGLAIDISKIRCAGSQIRNAGESNGAFPFIKLFEATLKAFDQQSKRKGSGCIYFPWWHLDFFELIQLKSDSGSEENRARHLQYAVILNSYLYNAVKEDKDVYLFDPKETTELTTVSGRKFDSLYESFIADKSIRKKKVKAREIAYQILLNRVETGNIYIFNAENANDRTWLGRYINSSNLCTEIMLPSRHSSDAELIDVGYDYHLKKYKTGEIALCNLASINLLNFSEKSISNLVRLLDNTIDLIDYVVPEARKTNKKYRYIGIGVSNYAAFLAAKKARFSSKAAKLETARVFDFISYHVLKASMELAKERGAVCYPNIFDVINLEQVERLSGFSPNYQKWVSLREDIKEYGLRNSALMAIAPTASSAKPINATEGIDPILDFVYVNEGNSVVKSLAPNIRKFGNYYEKAFDIDPKVLIELAAIRQCYIDQAQSLTLFYKAPESAKELWEDHEYAWKLGLKSLYYLKTKSEFDDNDTCESCT